MAAIPEDAIEPADLGAFLEKYPLYRKCEKKIPNDIFFLPAWPAINKICRVCRSIQTFNTNRFPASPSVVGHGMERSECWGSIVHAWYVCSKCDEDPAHYLIEIDPDGGWLRKIGQDPPWSVNVEPDLASFFGEELMAFFQHGRMFESQGYGIAACAYYRRLVDGAVDSLLDDVGELIVGDEAIAAYRAARESTRNERRARDKIDAIAELIPDALRPGGNNPFEVLSEILAGGSYVESEAVGLDDAEAIRSALRVIVQQVRAARRAATEFDSALRKLEARRKKRRAAAEPLPADAPDFDEDEQPEPKDLEEVDPRGDDLGSGSEDTL